QTVENRTGKPAEAREIADELGISLEEYFRLLNSAAAYRLVSLDEAREEGDPAAIQPPATTGEPCTELESEECRAAVAAAIRLLPEREALVMSMYYDEELNLKEIGEVLGVTESRVCQIHSQALARIRSRINRCADNRRPSGR